MNRNTNSTNHNDLEGLPPLLSPTATAELLNVNRKTVDRWLSAGRLRSIKVTPGGSGRRLIRRSEIERFLAECEDQR